MIHELRNLCGQPVQYYSCNTVIAGSGAAGFAAANRLLDLGQPDILLLTEARRAGTSRNTGSDKQTYYKLNLCGETPDSVQEMAGTLFSGESMDGDLALCEAANSARCFFYLCEAGVPFPFNGYGEFAGYKTDHDPAARATSAGPLTSKYMTECLERRALSRGLTLVEPVQITAVLRTEDRCCGLLGLNPATGGWVLVNATNVVYATGGPAGIYRDSVYPSSQTGGTGAALRAGVTAKNLMEWQYGLTSVSFRWNVSGSYQQVLPRYVSTQLDGSDPQEFLEAGFASVSEMLNAQFLKGYQWPFDPRKADAGGSSLLDILVYREINHRNRRVWLDYRQNPSGLAVQGPEAFSALRPAARAYLENSGCLLPTPIERLEHMNPNAAALYRNHGIDLRTEMLEISVCAQHNNGGLSGDLWWESNLPHFFPVGEVNGSHGVYRPGGCALNAGQVGALRAALKIAGAYTQAPMDEAAFWNVAQPVLEESLRFAERLCGSGGPRPQELRRQLTGLMSEHCAHIRSREKTALAWAGLTNLERRLETEASAGSPEEVAGAFRLRDLLLTAMALTRSIQAYADGGGGSRGSYLLEDMPLDQGAHRDRILEIQWADGELHPSWRPVRPLPEREQWFENVWRAYQESLGGFQQIPG